MTSTRDGVAVLIYFLLGSESCMINHDKRVFKGRTFSIHSFAAKVLVPASVKTASSLSAILVLSLTGLAKLSKLVYIKNISSFVSI